MEAFRESWAELDPDAKNYIASTKLVDLLAMVPPPLGTRGTRSPKFEAMGRCLKLGVPQYGGVIYFQDVLNSLTRYSYALPTACSTAPRCTALRSTPQRPVPQL